MSLGVTFVLFTGLVASALGARVDPAVLAFIRDFGLVLFVFFIGLQVGPSFFNSFRTHNGRTLNLLTIGIILAGLFLTLLFAAVLPGLVSLPQMLGIHFGAVTNTPGWAPRGICFLNSVIRAKTSRSATPPRIRSV